MTPSNYEQLIADLEANPASVTDARLNEAIAGRAMTDLDDIVLRELVYRGWQGAASEWVRRRDG